MSGSKIENYDLSLKQVASLLDDENDLVANLANITAVLKTNFNFWWVGFYIVKHEELVLGPFQGPVACTRIGYGKGVCGTAWQEKETIIVPDVHQFPGHIACSAESNSEIVVPVIKNGEVVMVLDVDSAEYNTFDQTDKEYLEAICNQITQTISL